MPDGRTRAVIPTDPADADSPTRAPGDRLKPVAQLDRPGMGVAVGRRGPRVDACRWPEQPGRGCGMSERAPRPAEGLVIDRIRRHAERLVLNRLATEASALAARAETAQRDYLDFLDLILEEEVGVRKGRRFRPFPDRAASLLPGILAATWTGLPPASADELKTTNRSPKRSTSCLPGARDNFSVP
jgi:hypothetical protein